MQDNPAPTSPVAPSSRWPIFLLGALCVLLGPIIYGLQFLVHIPPTPWYVPILATLGIALMLASFLQRGGIVRGVFLTLFALFGVFEWYMLLVGMVTPVYAGPAQPGNKLPTFATTRADGSTFTNHDLAKGGNSVLIFFRGRW